MSKALDLAIETRKKVQRAFARPGLHINNSSVEFGHPNIPEAVNLAAQEILIAKQGNVGGSRNAFAI